jgi:hypothetical protein
MMKKYAIWIVIAVILIIGIVVYFVIRKDKTAAGPTTTPGSAKGTSTSPVLTDASFPLKMGSQGKQVVILQGWMNMDWQKNLSLDGKFGNDTLTAWRSIAGSVYGIGGSGATSSQVSNEIYTLKILPDLSRIKSYLKSKNINI